MSGQSSARLAALIASLALLPTTFLSAGSAAAEEPRPYKIGLLLGLSGQGASGTTDGAQQALKIAIDDINSRNLAGRRFETVSFDDASDPRTSLDACNRMIKEEKVDVIVSQGPTTTRIACNQAAERAGVPHIITVHTTPTMCAPNMFVVGPETSQMLGPLVETMVKLDHKKLYFIGSDYSAPRDALSLTKSLLEAKGGTLVGSSFVPFGMADFSSEIGKIAAAKPDVVLTVVVGPDGVTFAQQFGADQRVAGVKRADWMLSPAMLKSLGANAVGIYSAASYFAAVDGPASESYKAEFQKRFGQQSHTDIFSVMMYDGLYLLAQAVKAAGPEPKAVTAALAGLSVPGPQGTVTLNATHYVTTPIYVAEVMPSQDLKIVASYPEIKPNPMCK